MLTLLLLPLLLLSAALPLYSAADLDLHAVHRHSARVRVGREGGQDARQIAHIPAAQASPVRRARDVLLRSCALRL
jgi:hypothetical protein